jgi:hypothetical protein
MDGFPNTEIESDLEASLRLVVRRGYLDLNSDSILLSLDVADVGNAIGAPEVDEELVRQSGIAEAHDHPLTVSHQASAHKSGPARLYTRLG